MRAEAMLLVLLSSAACAAELLLEAPAATVRVGDLVSWTVADAPATWLVHDVARTPRLTITAPDRTTMVRSAFLHQEHAPGTRTDGPEFVTAAEPQLRVRHVARTVGTHDLKLLDADGALRWKGVLTVVAGSAPAGPIRVSTANPRLLAFASGEPFIAIGPNVCWANGPDRLPRFEHFLDELADAGGNHTRIWFASWCGQVQGDDPARYRLDHAWLMDRILAKAASRGVRVTLVLDNFHDLITGKCTPYGSTDAARVERFLDPALDPVWRKKLAYVLARWGADDTVLAWELFNELDMAQPIRERTLPWLAAAAAELGRLDRDRRLHTVSWVGDDWERAFAIPGLDLVQLRGYVIEYVDPTHLLAPGTRDGVGMLLPHAGRALAFGRPFCFSEVGYQGTNEANRGHELDGGGLLLRQQAWAGLLLGGYGTGMSWWWDTYIEDRRLWSLYRPITTAVGLIDWRDRELTPLAPVDAKGQVRLLGWQSSTQCLLWPTHRSDTWFRHFELGQPRPLLAAGTVMRIPGLAPGTYSIRWVDQLSAAVTPPETKSVAAGETLAILLDGSMDRVLVIRKE